MVLLILSFFFFFCPFVFLVLMGFLEHVDNIAFQYFIAECACLLNSLPSYFKQIKVYVREREQREGGGREEGWEDECVFCSMGPCHP